MGGRNSTHRLPDSVKNEAKTFTLLGLKEAHVKKLHRVFSLVDKDGSGDLSLFELLDHLKLRRTEFSQRVFSIFDEDNSGQVDFREFVLALWNYCTLTKASLIIFAFDLYDKDESGSMELREMVEMCKDVYGPGYAKNRLAVQILEKIEKMNDISRGDGDVSVDKFALFCETHPGLLYPAFSFQQALQNKILGAPFWQKMAKQRLTLPTGVQVKVQDVLNSHVNETKFKEMAAKEKGKGLTSTEKRQARQALESKAVNGSFKDVFEHTGTKARRQTTHQQSMGRAATTLMAASTLRKLGETAKEARGPGNESVQRRAGAGGRHSAAASLSGPKRASQASRQVASVTAGKRPGGDAAQSGDVAAHRRQAHTGRHSAGPVMQRGASARYVKRGGSRRALVSPDT